MRPYGYFLLEVLPTLLWPKYSDRQDFATISRSHRMLRVSAPLFD